MIKKNDNIQFALKDKFMKEKIHRELSKCISEADFADKIFNLGEQFLISGELDSDELVWEVAREIWKEKNHTTEFEKEVFQIFNKLI